MAWNDSICSASTFSHNKLENKRHVQRCYADWNEIFHSSDLPHLVLFVCDPIVYWVLTDLYLEEGKKKQNLKLTVHFRKQYQRSLLVKQFFYRRWGMLSVAIDKFNRESTLQREVKLDTGEFDPLPATLRHFLLNLAAVRDDGLTAKEQNKRWGEMLEDGRMSEDMRPLWWEITEFIMVTDVNGFPTFSFFFPPLDASSYPDETRWQWENKW